MKRVAISACLLGEACRYDASDNLNEELLNLLEDWELVPFCPEDYCFGSPRPTMDLVEEEGRVDAISNESGLNLSLPIIEYAKAFFFKNLDITLFIGKDRSPSCGVKSSKVYNSEKVLLHKNGTGLMANEAERQSIDSWDAEDYISNHIS